MGFTVIFNDVDSLISNLFACLTYYPFIYYHFNCCYNNWNIVINYFTLYIYYLSFIFDNFNFYYNTDSRETKRIIKEDKCTSTSLTIEETLTDKTTGRVTIIDYNYTLDNNIKTYLFYVFKPLIISIIALFIVLIAAGYSDRI